MSATETIKSQYWAALGMLRQAIAQCPDALWESPDCQNQFWHVADHTIFYTHLYLHPSEADFAPWEKHREEVRSLKGPKERAEDGAHAARLGDRSCPALSRPIRGMIGSHENFRS